MRAVAVVTTSYPAYEGDPSGHFVASEAEELARRARVTVITAAGPCHGASRDDRGVRVIRLEGGGAFGWPGLAARIREKPRRAFAAARWMRAARTALLSLGPLDRVVAHWALPSAVPVAIGVAPRLEVVSHGGDVRLLNGLPAPARRAVVRTLLARVSRWRFVSESLRDDLAALLPRSDRDRLVAISEVRAAAVSFPDVTARAAALRKAALGGGHKQLVVCVGRLVPGKTFDRALDHVAREASRGTGPRVVVVGDGPERARLEARARALALTATFVGTTTRDDALAWIGAADVLLHASRKEGLSTVVREANALGTRVVVVP